MPIRGLVNHLLCLSPWHRRLFLVVIDALILPLAVWLSFWLRLAHPFHISFFAAGIWLLLAVLLVGLPLYALSESISSVGSRCVVLAGAVINADAQLELGVLVNSGAVVDHDAICGVYSQLSVNAAMAGGSRLGPLASLAAGEVLGRGEHRFAELELAPGPAYPSVSVSSAGSSG